MKRYLLAIILLLALSAPSEAAHIKGGFFTYKYLGPGTGTNLRYQITLTVYMICSATPAQVSDPINFTIFNAGTNQFLQNVSVSKTNEYQLNKNFDEPCITGNETGCYYKIVVYDLASIELPSTPNGYIVAYQRCCRIAGINNVINSGAVGNTFAINIPGTAVAPGAETNSSPMFLVNDTAVVCRNSYFEYSFQASDANGDSLSYSFCDAFTGGSQGDPAPVTATNPPYTPIPYQSPFSGAQPMGPSVAIDPLTGLISGTAPDLLGEYVVCVCVNEYRNGVLIGQTRKELHIRVNDCQPLQAQLDPFLITCDGFTVNFSNNATNQPGTQYLWTFGEPSSGANDTSDLLNPVHTYADTGIYIARLTVTLSGGLCAASDSMIVKVYPGFFPGFRFTGSCFTNPFQFTDTSSANYGVINSWSWNFGDATTLADTSHNQNPLWTYAGPGPKDVTFIVTSSKGCIDTVMQTVNVLDRPVLTLDFADTLICRTDAVQLVANGTGVFSWTPPVNIIGANTATPTVSPTTTTWYYVSLNDNGCINNDSVRVRVIPTVTLQAISDTTICQGDAIKLGASTDGLQYSWTPAANLDNPNILTPTAITNTTTTYQITSTVGSCSATDDVVVTTVPYPIANAGPDPIICYNTSTQLDGDIVGSSFTWSPVSYLSNATILNPIATPPRTTQYILSAYDTLGCPKPGRDTLTVTVNPKIIAFAGHDTTVVVGQPLQFNGSGGVNYFWTPSIGLNDPNIQNPVGIYGPDIDSVRYKLIVSDAIGCADSAFVTVRVFKTNPYIFVPTAFTPNGDGLNDVIRPIAVGIEKINYFSIYNRWGQRVFITSVNGQGWDGRINGRTQGSGVFVWMVSAVDYLGNHIFLKGTVTLIR
ncbi:MAG TPA: PKD domain-containing protein [Chitinophagaceae bacterium]|nr:PKD domain-containing protein [Chitinophagaceae bacterium]